MEKRKSFNYYKELRKYSKVKLNNNKKKAIEKVKYPTRLEASKRIGYKRNIGLSLYRVKIRKGDRRVGIPNRGRSPSKLAPSKSLRLNLKHVAERRANRKHKEMDVINSYWVGKTGSHTWYEVMMGNFNNKVLKKRFSIKKHNKRKVFRGLTCSGRKTRNL